MALVRNIISECLLSAKLRSHSLYAAFCSGEEHRAAQYRLAEMYENGLGTEVDYKQAMYWYKLSSTRYAYIEEYKGKLIVFYSHISQW